MPQYKINNKNLVFGLKWNQLTKTNKKQESILLSETLECPYGIVLTDNSNKEGNTQIGLTDDKSDLGSVSAAALFSKLVHSGIIIDELPDGNLWFCVVNKGQVLNTTDLIVAEDEFEDSSNPVMDFLADIGGDDIGDDDSVFIVSEKAESLLGEVLESFDYTLSSFSDFLDQKNVKNLVKYRSLGIKKMGGISPMAMVIFVVLVASLVWYFYPSSGEDDLPDDLSQDEQLFDDQPEQDSESSEEDSGNDSDSDQSSDDSGGSDDDGIDSEEFKELKENAIKEEKDSIYQDFSQKRLDNVVSRIKEISDFIPFSANGWEAGDIVFDGSNADRVTTNWKKEYGTPDEFRQYWDSRRDSESFSVSFSTDGNSAKVIFDLEKSDDLGFLGGGDLFEYLEGSSYDPFSLMSDLDNNGYGYSTSVRSLSERDEPIKGMPEDRDPYQRFLSINLMTFDFKTIDDHLINDFMSIINKKDMVLATSVRYNFKDGMNWKISGDFYDVQ